MANHLSAEKKSQIISLLCEGMGPRGIARATGRSLNTVQKLIKTYAILCKRFNDAFFKGLQIDHMEVDELHFFVNTKMDLCSGPGVKWLYVAIDRESKIIPAWHVGRRDIKDANLFLNKINDCLIDQCKVSSDGLHAYVAQINQTPLGYRGEKVKVELTRAEANGKSLGRSITNNVESQNGNLRQFNSFLGRRTRRFCKSLNMAENRLDIYFFYYNFVKIHKTIKTTPAIKYGLVEQVFSIEDLFSLASIAEEDWEIN